MTRSNLNSSSTLIYSLRLIIFAIVIFLLMVGIFSFVFYPAPHHPREHQRLIQWGHKTPRLQDIDAYWKQIEALPFDGIIFDITTPLDRRGLGWTLFTTPLDNDLLRAIREQFSDKEWGKLSDNFLRVNIYGDALSWEDDWQIALENLEAIARLAHDIGFVGIMLDTEQYGAFDLFDYPAQNAKLPRSYRDYADLAFQHGQVVMQSLQTGYPNISVMTTYGITHRLPNFGAPPLDQHRYGLLVPFLEGMIEVTDDPASLIDAYEGSYLYRTQLEFELAYKWIHAGVIPRLTHTGPYAQIIQAGFGLWIDPYCGEAGLPESGCGFTPDEFLQAVEFALNTSDRYVWIYDEHINWFTGEGIPLRWWDMMKSLGRD